MPLSRDPLRTTLALLLFAAGLLYAWFADYFGKEILAEIAVFAMLALALDLLAGFAGMVSLGHALFYGAGAYAFTLATAEGPLGPAAAMPAAVLFAALLGWLVGFATARTHGIFFIMATLAFGQMGYVFVFRSERLGGDDGLTGVPRLDLSAFGIDLFDPSQFAAFTVVCTGLVYLGLVRLLRSGFGRTLHGIHVDERRMRALGLPVARYKAAASAVAGGVAGLAGTLGAQHAMFVSPDTLHWTLSGEVLTMVILGGLGTLIGPVLGAVAVILLKYRIGAYTDHWMMFVGLFLIVAVMTGRQGLWGLLDRARLRLARSFAGPAGREVIDARRP